MLLLAKLDEQKKVAEERMFGFVSTLKHGKVRGLCMTWSAFTHLLAQGLALVASVVEGALLEKQTECQEAYKQLRDAMKKQSLSGFANVIASESIRKGVSYLIQGGIYHRFSQVKSCPRLTKLFTYAF